jgi:excisionase family DNA binding protein
VGTWRFFVPRTDGPTRKRGAVEHTTGNNEARDHLSPVQVADYLGVSRTCVYNLIGGPNPAIPSFKIGRLRRVRRVDVETYIEQRLREAKQ